MYHIEPTLGENILFPVFGAQSPSKGSTSEKKLFSFPLSISFLYPNKMLNLLNWKIYLESFQTVLKSWSLSQVLDFPQILLKIRNQFEGNMIDVGKYSYGWYYLQC